VVAPGLAASDGATSEGGSALEIPVQLYGSVDHAVSVDYATADGTALASTDYTATTGTLTFAPGQTTKSVSVPLLSDQITEPNESLTLTLANVDEGAATGPPVTLVNAVATGTIVDNDPKVSIGDARVKEGDKGTRKAALRATAASYGFRRRSRLGDRNAESSFQANPGPQSHRRRETLRLLHAPAKCRCFGRRTDHV